MFRNIFKFLITDKKATSLIDSTEFGSVELTAKKMKLSPDILNDYMNGINHPNEDNISDSDVQDQTAQPLLQISCAESTTEEMAKPSDRQDHCAINMPLDTGGMVLPQQSNTSDSDSKMQDRRTQDLKKWSTIENLHDGSDEKTSVHAESQAVDENLPEQNPSEQILDRTFVEKVKDGWEEWSIWDNISISIGPNGPPSGVILLALSLIVIHMLCYHKPSLRSSNELNCRTLKSTFESRSFEKTMISFHFFHKNVEHLIVNVFTFIISGIYIECIMGTIPFLSLFFGLCFTISKQWYVAQLENNSCESAKTVVGASGVVFALVTVAAILSLYNAILIAAIKFIQKREIEFSKFLLLIFSCIGFIVYTMIAVYQSIIDIFHPTTDVANDVHLIGLEIGAISGLLTAFFCLLRILSWSIIRLGFNQKSKILTILDIMIGFGQTVTKPDLTV